MQTEPHTEAATEHTSGAANPPPDRRPVAWGFGKCSCHTVGPHSRGSCGKETPTGTQKMSFATAAPCLRSPVRLFVAGSCWDHRGPGIRGWARGPSVHQDASSVVFLGDAVMAGAPAPMEADQNVWGPELPAEDSHQPP